MNDPRGRHCHQDCPWLGVAAATDLRNCAVYGLGDGYISGTAGQPSGDLAVVAALPKHALR